MASDVGTHLYVLGAAVYLAAAVTTTIGAHLKESWRRRCQSRTNIIRARDAPTPPDGAYHAMPAAEASKMAYLPQFIRTRVAPASPPA